MGRALEIRDDVGAHELRGWARKAAAEAHPDKTIELRFQDEARVGSKGRLGHRWWIKAYRAPGLSDKRFQWAYIFAAVHPATGEDVALAHPLATVWPARMALSHTHISLFCELRRAGVVGRGNTRSILEFGEQNWFGDVHPRKIYKLIDEFLEAGEERERATQELEHLISALSDSQAPGNTDHVLFDLAKFFYGVVLRHESYTAVDLHGTDAAQRHDLNLPLPIEDKFDLVTNLGTAEHVFNQFQFFCSLHERAKPGGLMIHELPNQGCYDHGFFNYHPTFVFDLCAANGYHIVAFLYVDGRFLTERLRKP